MSLPEKQELLALLEEKRRIRARNRLKEYARQIIIPGAPLNDNEDCEEFYPDNVTPAEHHDILMDALQGVADGGIKNLMILAPPGSAKSTYASVVFVTWFLGRFKNRSVIMTTYGSDLASKFGRKCRAVTKGPEFRDIFDCELMLGNAAADDWSLTNGSIYMSGGILSGITGNRAHGLIIDDPFKGREEVNSDTIRKKVKDEYRESLLTRLLPTGWQIIINTRWHQDDLCGDILPEKYRGDTGWITAKDGAKWYVLCLQAQCENKTDPLGRKFGEYLWTDWFSPEWWEQTKRTQQGYSWSALYQQMPTPEEGIFFRREWFHRYRIGNEPEQLARYGAGDFAVTEDGGDYTELGIGGFDVKDNLYFTDWWSGQADPSKWFDELFRLNKEHDPVLWAAESGVIKKSIEPFLKNRMRDDGYFRIEWIPTTGNKAAMAKGFQALASQGKVHIPLTPWGDALIDQLVSFPGKFDDKVDVCGLFGRILDKTFGPREIIAETMNKGTDYGQGDEDGEDWKLA
jgi:predicted phage terminase large subunit-like protein